MRKILVRCSLALSATLLAVWWASIGFSQGSGSSRIVPARPRRAQTAAEFQRSFWQFMNRETSPYKTWAPLPGLEGLREANSPHGKFIKSHANSIALRNAKDPPYGSILVTEEYDTDESLKSIAVMYRVQGTDREHNDWYWLKYSPDGSIAKDQETGKAIAGKVASCTECHRKAGSNLVYYTETAADGGQE